MTESGALFQVSSKVKSKDLTAGQSMKRRKRFVKGGRHKSSEALKKQHDKLKNLKKEESRSNRKKKDFLPIETTKEEERHKGK